MLSVGAFLMAMRMLGLELSTLWEKDDRHLSPPVRGAPGAEVDIDNEIPAALSLDQ